MFKYYTYLDELINNIKYYNLYFAVIKLALIGLEENITEYKFKSDIKYIKSIVKMELKLSQKAILDIDDGKLAFNDSRFQCYDIIILNKLIKDF